MKFLNRLIPAVLLTLAAVPQGDACSRVVLNNNRGTILIGRTLDWRTPIPTNIYVYPRGVDKESMPSGNRLTWQSKYASVLAVGYDGGVTEGMNEAGLSMNGLFCKGTIYPTAPENVEPSQRPVMSLAVLVSYFLDNFATAAEVKAALEDTPFDIAGKTFDGGTVSTLHWAVTDTTGMTVVLEYQQGRMHLYEGKGLKVMTNDPPLPQMQAVNAYWEQVGGKNMLPGTVRSSDRFARASYFVNHAPESTDYETLFASITSIMGTVSVPYGYEVEGEPNLSSTQWTSISDIGGGKYYFRFATSTGFLWVDLGRLQLNVGAPILKLDNTKHRGLTGCANQYLEKSPGFTPMY